MWYLCVPLFRSRANDEVIRKHLEINLPIKYFGNDKELATSFIEALHKTQIAKIVSKNDAQLLPNMFLYNGKNIIGEGNDEPFIKRGEQVSYDEIFRLIENQYSMLKLKMENFNAKYPNVKNDHALNTSSMINNLENWFNTTVKLSVLRNHVVTQNFLRNRDEELRNLRAELVYLEEQIEFNTDVKEELIKTSNRLKGELQETQVSEFAKELVNIDKTILSLKLRKKHVEDYLDANTAFGDDTEFLKQLQRYADRLVEETEDFNVFAIKHINSLVRYNDEYSPSIEFKSKFNMALMSIVLIMVGGIAGVSAGLIKGSVKKED